MASEGRAPCTLPTDYRKRWLDLAKWSCKHEHGPASRYAIMYALTLRRSVLADRAHITFISPRVWEVQDGLVTSQRIALFDDRLVERLLHNIDNTADFPTPLFPVLSPPFPLPQLPPPPPPLTTPAPAPPTTTNNNNR